MTPLDPSLTGVASAQSIRTRPTSRPSVTYADAANLDACTGAGTVLRTWTATDIVREFGLGGSDDHRVWVVRASGDHLRGCLGGNGRQFG